jgi:hypothetical protein
MDVALKDNRVQFGDRFSVSLHRTLRIPDDGRVYPLPPGLGLFPLRPASTPAPGLRPEVIVPLYQREALWLGFSAAPWKPNAVKVIAGGMNAISGLPDTAVALGDPQDYLVCPDQPWLDGFNAGGGVIRQFVAMPLGQGYGIEAGAGLPESGGLEIIVFDPEPGHFPDAPSPERPGPARPLRTARRAEPREMALGASGRMRQTIYPDRYGRAVWQQDNAGRARIRILNSRGWRELTKSDPPATPIDTAAYTAAGLPWFDLYDEHDLGIAPSDARKLKTVGDRDRELRIDVGDPSVDVPESQVTIIDRRRKEADH